MYRLSHETVSLSGEKSQPGVAGAPGIGSMGRPGPSGAPGMPGPKVSGAQTFCVCVCTCVSVFE